MTRGLGAYRGVLVVGLAFGAWLIFRGFRSREDVPPPAREMPAADLDGEVILDGLRLGTERDEARLPESELGAAPPSVSVEKVDEPGPPDPNRDPVAALIDELSSDDAEARRAAADQIVSGGYFTIEQVARQATSLDAESWQAFADAVIGKTWFPSPACALVAAAHAAPEAHRRRLIDLARRLKPEAGRTPTPQEIEALVRRELVETRVIDDDFFGEAVAIYGHAGMQATLSLLREGNPDTVDLDRASSLLSTIAQPEDIPALRTLLLEGNPSVTSALSRLDSLGFTKASDVLIEAVRSGRFDSKIAFALGKVSKPRLAAQAMRQWLADRGRSLTEEDQGNVAEVFAALGSRADVSTLKMWSSSSRNSATLFALGKALTKLGSTKGIDMLVRIVEEKKVEPPIQPASESTGRLRAGGFEIWQRKFALRSLSVVVVQLSDSGDKQGPWKRVRSRDLDRVALAVRAWWEASRDRIQFDEKAGEWRLRSD